MCILEANKISTGLTGPRFPSNFAPGLHLQRLQFVKGPGVCTIQCHFLLLFLLVERLFRLWKATLKQDFELSLSYQPLRLEW